MSLYIKYKENFFQFHHADGNRNCIYNSLYLSAAIDGNIGPEIIFDMIYYLATLSSYLLFIFVLSFYYNIAFTFLLKAHHNLMKALY